jgi:L-alanine-DL-glutamate epimerase-like enolase superfamily enzyme
MTHDDPVIDLVRAAILEVPVGADLRAYGPDHVSVVFIEMTDDMRRAGTGFTYTFGPGCAPVKSMVDDVIAPLIQGTRLAEWEQTYRELRQRTRRIGRHVFIPAISAVDIAAWDLRGRSAGLPLYRLLGGTQRAVPIYGSGRSANALPLAELVAGAESYVAEGYEAIKLRVGVRAPEEDLARLAAVRRAVGDQVGLMVDCNERLNLATALWLCERAADLGVRWIEEPLPAEHLQAYAMLADRSPTPIATGEHLVALEEFEQYAHAHAAALFQPDAALAGGITGCLEICQLARAYGVPVSLHSVPELHVQVATSDPNACYVEHFPILDTILAARLEAAEGRVSAPTRPGHGMVWDHDAIAAHTVAGGFAASTREG